MFNKLDKTQAKELDELFEVLLQFDGVRTSGGLIPLATAVKEVEALKDKDASYIQSLMYIAREAQHEVPTLFHGSELLLVHKPAVKDFLRAGGFTKYYQKNRRREFYAKWQFWLAVIVALLTALALFN